MSEFFDDDANLAGVFVEVTSDYSLGYDTSLFGTTDSVVVIGTAFNGPVGKQIPIYSPEHAAYIFGNTYDSAKRKEVTLVAGIQDAWNRGCRTIYGCRISGKDIYKDFDLNINTDLKLRVSSMFPSNVAKNCFIKYDSTVGAESLTIYKPASRATIAEKKRGDVESATAIMQIELRLAVDNGFSRDTNLVDIIRYVNNRDTNNVLQLSIVNSEGVNVTDSDEAYALPLGVLFPGVYFIGRDRNSSLCPEITQSKLVVANSVSDQERPYNNFDRSYFRKLEINTDVSSDLPIYYNSKNKAAFKDAIRKAGISMASDWDFLGLPGIPDKAFLLDSIDYEETSLSTFETYKRLGMGYAITAKAEKRTKTNPDGTEEEITPRIKETPISDTQNYIQPITDGIYAALQNAEIDYRILTNAYADENISSKLPRAKDFKETQPESISVLNDYIELTTKVAADDNSSAKKYNIKFNTVDTIRLTEAEIEKIKTDEVFDIVAKLPSGSDLSKLKDENGKAIVFSAGTTLLLDDTLIRVTNGGYALLNGAEYEGKHVIVNNKIYRGTMTGSVVTFTEDNNCEDCIDFDFVLGNSLDNVLVYKKKTDDSTSDVTISPLGDLSTLLGENDEEDEANIMVFATDMPMTVNEVIISSHMYDNITVDELLGAIDENIILNKLFKAKLTEDGAEVKDDMVSDLSIDFDQVYELKKDRNTGYNYSIYIPYRTTDNFARQLAQHCTQTEIYTHPTHGIIGCVRQTDNGLAAIAKRVNELRKKNFDLYAKNIYGQNMNDKNGYPFPIGKNVSIVFGQHYVPIDDENYTFLSCGGPSYAGMLSKLPLDQAPTCQTIDIDSINFNLTNSQLTALTAAGIVTFKRSFSKGIVVTDGITMAPADSYFRRLATTRIINSIEDMIRACAEPYIGKQNTYAHRNALQTAIASKLNSLMDTLIQKYTFKIDADPNANQLSYVTINYKIQPINEIREIRNKITVTDNV